MLCPTCPREFPNIVRNKGDQCSVCSKPSWQGKIREKAVGAKLVEWAEHGEIPLFTSADKSISIGTKFRPDFFWNCGLYNVILEVDEEQHNQASYNASCELTRMDGLAESSSVPTIIIRFNPDAFKISGMTERVSKDQRYEVLLEVLKQHLTTGSGNYLTICYVFFNQSNRLMHGERLQYVTHQTFQSQVDYETHAGGLYPSGCSGAAGPWYAKVY